MKVLLLEDIHPSSQVVFDDAGIEVVRRSGSLDEAELIEALEGVDLLGIRSNTRVTEKVLDAVPHLQAVGCFCIGTNQVALAAAAERAEALEHAASEARDEAQADIEKRIPAAVRAVSDELTR